MTEITGAFAPTARGITRVMRILFPPPARVSTRTGLDGSLTVWLSVASARTLTQDGQLDNWSRLEDYLGHYTGLTVKAVQDCALYHHRDGSTDVGVTLGFEAPSAEHTTGSPAWVRHCDMGGCVISEPHTHGQNPAPKAPDTDALAEAIVSAVLDWAGDNAESLAFAEELLRRTPLLEGSAA